LFRKFIEFVKFINIAFLLQGLGRLQKEMAILWHPYTQQRCQLPLKGKGALFGDKIIKIDAIAWWVNPYGHSNTFIADAIYKQLTTLEHVLFGGFTHEPAIEVREADGNFAKTNKKNILLIMDQQLLKLRLKSLCSISSKGQKKTTIAFENA
jgi:adenosylmethionine-8-amino-7-oxononanoate aminotransferase